MELTEEKIAMILRANATYIRLEEDSEEAWAIRNKIDNVQEALQDDVAFKVTGQTSDDDYANDFYQVRSWIEDSEPNDVKKELQAMLRAQAKERAKAKLKPKPKK